MYYHPERYHNGDTYPLFILYQSAGQGCEWMVPGTHDDTPKSVDNVVKISAFLKRHRVFPDGARVINNLSGEPAIIDGYNAERDEYLVLYENPEEGWDGVIWNVPASRLDGCA